MSSSTPFVGSFGVEMEFLVVCNAIDHPQFSNFTKSDLSVDKTNRLIEKHSIHSFYATLRHYGIDTYDPFGPPPSAPPQKWQLSTDASCFQLPEDVVSGRITLASGKSVKYSGPKSGHIFCVELISRVLPCKRAAVDEVTKAASIAKQAFPSYVNRTCGLHVHVGNGTSPISFAATKNLLGLALCFEKEFESMHSARRIGHFFCASLTGFFPDPRTPEHLMETLNHFANLPQLVDVLRRNTGFARPAFNVSNLDDFPESTGTIEFRQHEATLDPEAVCQWAMFLVTLMRRCYDGRIPVLELVARARATPRFDALDLMRMLRLDQFVPYYQNRLREHVPRQQGKVDWDDFWS